MKFDDERGVFGFIYHTVREGLQRSIENTAGNDADGYLKGRFFAKSPSTSSGNGQSMAELIKATSFETPFAQGLGGAWGSSGVNTDIGGTVDGVDVGTGAAADDTGVNNQYIIDNIFDNVIQFTPERPLELIQCYQIHGIFILVPVKNGIWLIDQHAAHERVLYEQGLNDLETARPVSQQLLFPIVIEMGLAEKTVLESGMNYFSSLGFEISDFGGQSVSISALPAFVRDGQAESTVREMVRYLLDGRNPDAFKEPIKRFAAAFACGAAIKSGQKLSQEEMNALINALFSADNPYTCPHGRPTIVKISIDELTRRFLR
jgi:DNA mismatch repair protein MutL